MTIKLIDQGAVSNMTLPVQNTYNSTGARVYTSSPIFLQPRETRVIPLGFSLVIPDGYMGLILPIPSLAQKGITCLPVPFDSEYREEICAYLTNVSNQKRIITRKEAVGQIVLMPAIIAELVPEEPF